MPKTCKSTNCVLPIFGKGYCKKHQYLRSDIKPFSKPRIPIKAIGNIRRADRNLYKYKRRKYLEAKPLCKAKLLNCTKIASDIHHTKGRGIYFLDETTWISVCRNCHHWIEMHPKEAKELNLSQSRF